MANSTETNSSSQQHGEISAPQAPELRGFALAWRREDGSEWIDAGTFSTSSDVAARELERARRLAYLRGRGGHAVTARVVEVVITERACARAAAVLSRPPEDVAATVTALELERDRFRAAAESYERIYGQEVARRKHLEERNLVADYFREKEVRRLEDRVRHLEEALRVEGIVSAGLARALNARDDGDEGNPPVVWHLHERPCGAATVGDCLTNTRELVTCPKCIAHLARTSAAEHKAVRT